MNGTKNTIYLKREKNKHTHTISLEGVSMSTNYI